MTEEEIRSWGLCFARELPNGDWIGLLPFLFTVGLVVGVDGHSYRTRFCYPKARIKEAFDAVMTWDGKGDPPGHWIKEKGYGYERHNPRVFFGIPVIVEALLPEPTFAAPDVTSSQCGRARR